jgi:molecular chaperone GrpE (heat shock protein)
MTQEKDKLQNELNKKGSGSGSSLPTPSSDNEEDKREELENSKLTLEQLREKLKITQAEVRNLRTQLNQQNNRVNHHEGYNFGTLFVVGVVCLLLGSLIAFVVQKKKKKKKHSPFL